MSSVQLVENEVQPLDNVDNNSASERHMTCDMRYRRALVSLSDSASFDDYAHTETILVGTNFAVSAWEDVVPYPKYVLPQQRKKKVDSAAEEEEDPSLSSPSTVSLGRNYELDFVNCPARQMGVEPMTYRYIPNNGRYRATKLAKRIDTPKAYKKGFSSSKLLTDKQFLHNEIQRELRKEFEMFISLERQRSSIMRQKEAKLRLADGSFERFPHSQTQGDSRYNFSLHSHSNRPPNLPRMDLQKLSREQGQYYLEQVSSRLRDLDKSVNTQTETNASSQREGFLSANSVIKHASSESSLYISPRDISSNNVPQLNKNKLVPGITEQKHKETQPSVAHVTNEDTYSSADLFYNELRIRKMNALNSGYVSDNDTLAKKPEKRETLQNLMKHGMKSQPLRTEVQTSINEPETVELAIKPNGYRSREKRVGSGRGRPVDQSTRLQTDIKRHVEQSTRLQTDIKRPVDQSTRLQTDIKTVLASMNPGTATEIADIRNGEEFGIDSHSVGTGQRMTPVTHQHMRFVDPRNGSNPTPHYEDYAKSQLLRRDSGRVAREMEKMHYTLAGRLPPDKTKLGTSQLVKAAPPRGLDSIGMAGEGGGVLKTFERLPISSQQTATGPRAAMSSNCMPVVLVRRAEMALTSKRII